MSKKKTKYLWIAGGFGNVLFQLLAQEALLKRGELVYIVPTLTQKNVFTKILKWKIHEELYRDIIDSNKMKKYGIIKSTIIVTLAYISRHLNIRFKFATFYDTFLTKNEEYAKNIFGYFQHPRFLSSNKESLLQLGKVLFNKYSLNDKYPIVVHYRRGDSVWAQKHANYYHEVRLLLKEEKENVLIVTDDLLACKDYFESIANCSFVSSKNAIDDFKYMLSAQKLICAPSTFSWWAAHSLPLDTRIIMPRFFEENLGIYLDIKRVKII